MKAAIYTKFGPPDVLRIKEVPNPVPLDNEVLVRIYATTVEKEDPDLRKGPGINGILKPKKPILGMELSGEIACSGKDVTLFKAGDKVYGNAGLKLGTCAEYICLPETGCIAIKPDMMSYEEAAAVTNGALTALPFLRDLANIGRGQRILVNGASGSVGTAAIQIAKYYGATVTGVCSTGNLELVKSLGADRVIDYTKEDFTKTPAEYDIIFDVAGKTSYSRCKHLLSEKGTYLSTVPTPAILLGMLFTIKSKGRKIRFTAAGLRKQSDKAKDLHFLTSIIDAGKFNAVIDSRHPLEQIAQAHAYVEKGHKRGSVVITIR